MANTHSLIQRLYNIETLYKLLHTDTSKMSVKELLKLIEDRLNLI